MTGHIGVELSGTNRNQARSSEVSLMAIVFDMDGTLVSSLPVIFHCENEISRKYAKATLSLEDVISKFGPPAHAIIRSMTSSLPETLQSQAVVDYYECYQKNVPARGLAFPGFTNFLGEIQSASNRLGLVIEAEKALMNYPSNPSILSGFSAP